MSKSTKGYVAWIVVWAIGVLFVAPFVPTSWLFLAGAFTWGLANVVERYVNNNF